MTRDQLQAYFKCGSIRNTNRILKNLAPYLLTIREGYQSIYYLNSDGRAYVDCEKVRKKASNVKHTVMRNDFWIYNGCPPDWRNEVKVSDGKVIAVVDAMFSKSLQTHFLEVDHAQTMRENRVKIERFKELHERGLIEKTLGHFPVITWLTTTENRRKQLVEASKQLPRVKVYTMEDIR